MILYWYYNEKEDFKKVCIKLIFGDIHLKYSIPHLKTRDSYFYSTSEVYLVKTRLNRNELTVLILCSTIYSVQTKTFHCLELYDK